MRIFRHFVWCLCVLLLSAGTPACAAVTNQASAILVALSSRPGDKTLLAQLKASLPTLTHRADRCRPGVVYCLGCLSLGDTTEGLAVRDQILKAFPLDPLSKLLTDDNITETCPQCTGGRTEADCPKCHGGGTCSMCDGAGSSKVPGFDKKTIACVTCKGTGKCRECAGSCKTQQYCRACKGRGMVASAKKCNEAYLALLQPALDAASQPASAPEVAATEPNVFDPPAARPTETASEPPPPRAFSRADAVKRYREAADKGDADAQVSLANC
ncbi:MAG: hypothetical protein ACOYOU_09465, partial [Kiritimatiellia bacterium]